MNRKIEKLNGRDMINIGIYAAIYFVIAMALAFTGLISEFYEGEREGSIRIGGQEAGGHIYDFAGRALCQIGF